VGTGLGVSYANFGANNEPRRTVRNEGGPGPLKLLSHVDMHISSLVVSQVGRSFSSRRTRIGENRPLLRSWVKELDGEAGRYNICDGL
jgi:hypothetical protein